MTHTRRIVIAGECFFFILNTTINKLYVFILCLSMLNLRASCQVMLWSTRYVLEMGYLMKHCDTFSRSVFKVIVGYFT